MTERAIVTEQHGHVLEIRIERPERRNALTHAMYRALLAALDQAESDTNVRVTLLTGTEDCFTAGNDMNDFLESPPDSPQSPVMQLLERLPGLTKPLVAAVTGPAVGIGTTLLLHCDLVYLGEGTRLQLPFVNLGLSPEAGSSLLLPLLAGQARAAELLLLGETFDARTAREIGLANAVLADEACLAHARERAARLAAQPPAAVRASRALLRRTWQEAVTEQIRTESEVFIERLRAPEAREAISAFLEKRPPDFSRFD
jgi:enoyl-CoA hydratase/carnithine racemase